jgi:integrase
MNAPTTSDNPAEADPAALAEPEPLPTKSAGEAAAKKRKPRPSGDFDESDIRKAIEQQVRRTWVWDTDTGGPGGLYLMYDPPGWRHPKGLARWMFRYTSPATHRVTESGIGHWPRVQLEQARVAVQGHRHFLRQGLDPQQVRRISRGQTTTFQQAGDAYIETRKDWTPSSLRAAKFQIHHHGKSLLREGVGNITRVQVEEALNPLCTTYPKQALRVLATWRLVFDFARYKGWRVVENPSLWKGMHVNRFRFRPEKKHHQAMPYAQVPEFIKALRQQHDAVARALEFCILTATRTGETLGMQWTEIVWDQKIWIIPGERMKGRKEHRVPLCGRLMELLALQRNSANGSPYVFPREGRKVEPLPERAMYRLLRKMDIKFAVHGFRASSRNWAGRTRQDRDLAEMCLAHKVKGEVEAAYWHEDMLAERRPIMDAWSQHCG